MNSIRKIGETFTACAVEHRTSLTGLNSLPNVHCKLGNQDEMRDLQIEQNTVILQMQNEQGRKGEYRMYTVILPYFVQDLHRAQLVS